MNPTEPPIDITPVAMTLWIADKKINRFMKGADLCPDYKVFISEKQRVTYKTTSKVNEAYIQSLIEKSRSQNDYWIPAIEWADRLYVAKGIMEISDGQKVAFVGEAA